jgi:hypothetical protein
MRLNEAAMTSPYLRAALPLSLAVLVPGCVEQAILGTLPGDAASDALRLELDSGHSPVEASGLEDGGDGGKSCATNEGCTVTDEFCRWPDGQCSGPGVCTVKPASCPSKAPRLCACDKITVDTECELERMGENVSSSPPCMVVIQIEAGPDSHVDVDP